METEQAQSDVAYTEREADAAVAAPNVKGRWDVHLSPHNQPGVVMSFSIFIDSGPDANGIIGGSLVDAKNNPILGGRLVGILRTIPANIIFFKLSVGGIRYHVIGIVTGAAFPLKFNGEYIRNIDGAAVAAEPGETGTGGGSQGTR